MTTLAEIRQKYPQYNSIPDDQLADALHQKYYSSIPRAEFRAKIGLGNGASGGWNRGAEGSWDDPALADKSPLEKFRMGGKVALGGIGLGVKQLLGKATEQDVAQYRKDNAGILQDPTVSSGNLMGNVMAATPLMLAPGGGTILGSGAYGGLFGAIQPVGPGESRVENTAQGLVTSAGVTAGLKAIGRVAQPVANVLTDEAKQAADLLRKAGVRLSVGQQTGSRTVQSLERTLNDNPYTGPAMADEAAKSQRTLTRAFLRTAGVNADAITPQVANAAERRIGTGINTINSRYSLDVNSRLQDLTDIADEAKRILPDDGKRITAQVDQIVSKAAATGTLDAKAAQKIRTELGTLSRDPVVGEYAYKLRETLDDMLQDAAKGTGDFAEIQKLRSQYRNLQAIIDSADTTADAQVSGPRLASTLASGKYTKGSMRKGRGDTELSELARAASTFKDRFPNSGTAARAGAQMIAPTLVAGASYLQDRDASKALGLAAATYGLPKAAAAALNTPATANYLANGIAMPPVANQLGQYLTRIAPPVATGLVLSQ